MRPLARRPQGEECEGTLAVRPRAARPAPHDRLGRRCARGAAAARLADRPPCARIRSGCAGVTHIPGRTSGSSPRGTPPTGWSPRSSARPCSTATRRSETTATSTPPGQAVRFLLEAPKTLYEDDDRRCLSYVPDQASTGSSWTSRPWSGPWPPGWARSQDDAELIRAGRPAGPLRGVEADRLWRLVLHRPAFGQPHHPRQLPHRVHPRRDPAVRASRRQRRVRGRLPAGASSSTSSGCSSRTARRGS